MPPVRWEEGVENIHEVFFLETMTEGAIKNYTDTLHLVNKYMTSVILLQV